MTVMVDGCPCEMLHGMTDDVHAQFTAATAGLPATVPVETPDGTWLVPRVFIACHGLRADELPELAALFGWERRR